MVAAAIGPCVVVAWQNRFTQDDAYISWTYAKHLVEGKGLVWSSAPPVEGYTNFLWTLIATVPLALDWDIERFFHVLGILLFCGSLLTVYALVQRLCGDPIVAVCAVLATGLFFSFNSYATGGLETQLQALLGLQVALASHRLMHAAITWRAALPLGVAALLAVLTRLDSVVLIAPMFAVVALARVQRYGTLDGLLPLAVASAIVGVGVAPWFIWKLGYYGSILPNSYRAKVQSFLTWPQGFRYLAAFFWSNFFVPPLLGAAVALFTARREHRGAEAALLALPVVAWLTYVARVGGDFMEFRMLVVVIPLVMVLCFVGLRAWSASPAVAFAVLLLILGGSEHHRRFYQSQTYGGPTSIESLAGHLDTKSGAWREIGKRLHAAFADAEVKPIIAVTPAGAIVFYSELPAIDMLGVNDAGVEQFLLLPYMEVGHNRLISLAELRRRGTHFLIAHPVIQYRPPAAGDREFLFDAFSARRFFRYDDEDEMRGMKLIELPLPDNRVVLMVYLSEDPAIDARLGELGWRVYPSR